MHLSEAEIQGLRAMLRGYAVRASTHNVPAQHVREAVIREALEGSGLAVYTAEGVSFLAKIYSLLRDVR
jgi:hypothetical protein